MSKNTKTNPDMTNTTVKDLGDKVVIEKEVDGMKVLSYFPKKREDSQENLEKFLQAIARNYIP